MFLHVEFKWKEKSNYLYEGIVDIDASFINFELMDEDYQAYLWSLSREISEDERIRLFAMLTYSIPRRIKWLTENPGTQLTGSFFPMQYDWYAMAYDNK